MTWREPGVSKTTGKPYSGFWACPTRNEQGYCKGKPNTLPQRPQAPQTQVNTQTHNPAPVAQSALQGEILSELKKVNEKLDWFQNNFIDNQMGLNK